MIKIQELCTVIGTLPFMLIWFLIEAYHWSDKMLNKLIVKYNNLKQRR